MNPPDLFITRLFAWLLQLYPKAHQEAYREEMISVFSLAAGDCARRGRWSMLVFGLRELRDFPLNMLKAHLEGRKELTMAGATGETGVLSVGNTPHFEFPLESWREAIFAALPYILLPLTVLISLIDRWLYPVAERPRDFQSPLMIATQILFIVILVGMVTAALITWKRKGLRRWISSWLGWGLLILLWLILVAMNQLFHNYELNSPYFLILLPVFFIGCMLLGWKDRAGALLSALGPVLIIITLVVAEGTQVNLRGLAYGFLMLLAAGVSLVITRWGNWRMGAWLVSGVLLLGGSVISIVTVYFNTYDELGYSYVPSMTKVIDNLNGFLFSGGFILAPLLLLELGKLAWKGGLFSRTGWLLVLGGLIAALAGSLGRLMDPTSTTYSAFHLTTLIGIGAYIMGSLLLVGSAWMEKNYPVRRGAFVFVLLPLTVLFGAVDLPKIPPEAIFALSLVWLMLICWAAAKINSNPLRS